MEPTWQTEDGSVRLYLGDCLEVLPTLERGSIDAVVTDPPYSSGGAFRGDRTQDTITKYVRNDTHVASLYSGFTGDTRDQRSFFAWCSLWLLAARYASRDGAVLASFIDWRQMPVLTDAVQAGGWVWRNIATWWKPGCRMQKGRFSSSAEYVVYATNGPHDAIALDSPQNVISCASLGAEEKDHIAEKPPEVANWLVGLASGGTVLDPFMGSCAFGVAAIQRGLNFVGIENDPRSFELSRSRIEAEFERVAMFEPKPVVKQKQAF